MIRHSCFAALLASLLLASELSAGSGRASLRGISSVSVVIESLPSEMTAAGFSEDQFRTDVEVQLRKARIKVSEPSGVDPWIYLRVGGYSLNDPPVWAFNISVEFNQTARLVRDPSIVVDSTTWSSGGIVTLGSARLDTLRPKIRDYIDKFINDFLAVNPR